MLASSVALLAPPVQKGIPNRSHYASKALVLLCLIFGLSLTVLLSTSGGERHFALLPITVASAPLVEIASSGVQVLRDWAWIWGANRHAHGVQTRVPFARSRGERLTRGWWVGDTQTHAPDGPDGTQAAANDREKGCEMLYSATQNASSEQQSAIVNIANEALCQRRFLVALGFATTVAVNSAKADDAKAFNGLGTRSNGIESSSVFEISEASVVTPAISSSVAPAGAFGKVAQKAAEKAFGGGRSGALAAVVQVFSFMWLRTAMNYQYRYGGGLGTALKNLTDEGGIARLYQGLPFALVQGPLIRFGDTASNVGVLALLDSIPETVGLPRAVKTAAASAVAGLWRIMCMPVDTSKTVLQVEGQAGLERLKKKVLKEGPAPLYYGSIASGFAAFAGHFPWFATYNYLDASLPPVSRDELLLYLLRSALLGVSASCVSDTASNSLRVIKTTQQTAALKEGSTGQISFAATIAMVLETDGIKGLFGRGLKTRLLSNGIQGAAFSVLWRYIQASGDATSYQVPF